MAFKGIDFAKMAQRAEERRAMDPKDREALEAREEFGRDARLIAADERDRDGSSPEHRVVKLAMDPEVRFGMNDDFMIQLAYSKDGKEIDFDAGAPNLGRIVYASSEAQSSFKNSERHEIVGEMINGLSAGSTVSVVGEDRERGWRDREGKQRFVTEFQATRMAEGEVSREALMEPSPIAKASRAYVEAETDQDRELIARRFLGQPEVDRVASKGLDAGDDLTPAHSNDRGAGR